MSENDEELLRLLLDKTADLGTRHDLAMDAYQSEDTEVEAALIRIASDPSEEELVIDAAGESLWQIWSRRGKRDAATIARLQPSARKFFEGRGPVGM